jgi:hypothetical protein
LALKVLLLAILVPDRVRTELCKLPAWNGLGQVTLKGLVLSG